MHIMMSLITIYVAFASPTDCSPVRAKLPAECTPEAHTKANDCADKLWFVGRHSRRYPENTQELSQHCTETAELISCVKTYTDRCGNELQRQLANVMLFTMRTNDKIYCNKSAKKREFVALGLCGNTIREQTNKCMDQFLLLLGKSSAYETRFKVPHACCSYHKLQECILESAHHASSGQCSEKSVDSLEKYLSTLSMNTVNLMCNEYEEGSDKCQTIPKLNKGVKYSRALNIIEGFGNLLNNLD